MEYHSVNTSHLCFLISLFVQTRYSVANFGFCAYFGLIFVYCALRWVEESNESFSRHTETLNQTVTQLRQRVITLESQLSTEMSNNVSTELTRLKASQRHSHAEREREHRDLFLFYFI
jgi:hypothetical protein